jgi:hypothetical protein
VAVITTYTSLLTAIGDYLKRSNLTSFAPNFVQAWEEKFYRQPRNFGRWMEVTGAIGTIASSVVAVPADYLGLKVAYVDGENQPALDRKSLTQLYGRYPRGVADTGTPKQIARDGTNFVFGPLPDDDYTIKGVYWGKPVVLRSFAGDAAAHWLIVNAPDLVLYGSLLQAEPFSKNDARIPIWQQLYSDALQDYRALHREEDESGSPFQEVLA